MRPYPWQSLPRISRQEAHLTRDFAAFVEPTSLGRARAALASTLEVEIDVAPGPIGTVEGAALPASLGAALVAVALERPLARLALELDAGMTLAAIDRVLGGEGVSGAGPLLLSPVEQGVVAFVAARACEGTGLAVVDVLTTREGLGAWLGEGPIAWWSLDVRLGARTGGARLWAPARSLAGHRAPPRAVPEPVGALGVALRVVVGRARLVPSAILALGVGDVVLPDELGADRVDDAPVWSEASLRTRGGTVVVELAREGQAWKIVSVASARAVSAAASVEVPMSDGEAQVVRTDELSEVAEVPVELAIELGRIELRVRELAALVPGRVLSARVPVGREVELRAGDRVVARGELVDIDGELGIRILAR